jgi:hypothetical protein
MGEGLPQCKPKKKTLFSKWANLSRRVLQLMKESSSIEGVGGVRGGGGDVLSNTKEKTLECFTM